MTPWPKVRCFCASFIIACATTFRSSAPCLYLQTIGMPEGELRHGFRRTQQRIDGLGLLFRNLLGPSRITSVQFDAYLVDLCTSLVGGFDARRQLRRGVDVAALSLELDMAGPLGLVIGEILFTVFGFRLTRNPVSRQHSDT